MLCGHVECVNYKCCDLIGTPKFLPLDQECCRFSPDPLGPGVFIKGGTGNEEMGNGEIWKRRNGLEMVVNSVCSTVLCGAKQGHIDLAHS